MCIYIYIYMSHKVSLVKSSPLQIRALQMYNCTLSLTISADVVGSQLPAQAALPPERPGTHCIEAGWALGPVWKVAENLAHHRHSFPVPPSPYGVAIPTTACRPTLDRNIKQFFYKLFFSRHKKNLVVAGKLGYLIPR